MSSNCMIICRQFCKDFLSPRDSYILLASEIRAILSSLHGNIFAGRCLPAISNAFAWSLSAVSLSMWLASSERIHDIQNQTSLFKFRNFFYTFKYCFQDIKGKLVENYRCKSSFFLLPKKLTFVIFTCMSPPNTSVQKLLSSSRTSTSHQPCCSFMEEHLNKYTISP